MLVLIQSAVPQPITAGFLERLWEYLMLGASGIITEEATPLIGGLAAHNRNLRLSAVGMWVAGGTWLAGIGLYYFGRWRGDWARRRWPNVRRIMLRAFKVVRRHPWRSALAVRWAYGLRLTLPIACGAARLPLPIYLIGSAVSCLTWSFLFTLLGWAFGRTTLIVLGHVRRYENYLVLAIFAAVALAFWLVRKKHVEDEVVDVLASGDTGEIPKVSLSEMNGER